MAPGRAPRMANGLSARLTPRNKSRIPCICGYLQPQKALEYATSFFTPACDFCRSVRRHDAGRRVRSRRTCRHGFARTTFCRTCSRDIGCAGVLSSDLEWLRLRNHPKPYAGSRTRGARASDADVTAIWIRFHSFFIAFGTRYRSA